MKFLHCVAVAALVATHAPAQERESFGTKLAVNKGELYYKDSVEKDEARRLGEYLKENKFYDGTKKSAQVAKSGKTYQFRIVVKTGIDKDDEVADTMKVFAKELSQKVFADAPVEIHMCDPQFKTLRTVIMTK